MINSYWRCKSPGCCSSITLSHRLRTNMQLRKIRIPQLHICSRSASQVLKQKFISHREERKQLCLSHIHAHMRLLFNCTFYSKYTVLQRLENNRLPRSNTIYSRIIKPASNLLIHLQQRKQLDSPPMWLLGPRTRLECRRPQTCIKRSKNQVMSYKTIHSLVL